MILTTRAILFDMDGTLVNSDAAVRRIWTNFAERLGLDVDEIQKTSHGVKMIETIEQWAPAGTDAKALERELQAIELADTDGTVAVSGAGEFLASLPPDRVALVTSASAPLARVRMELCGLPVPAVLVTAEEVSAGKPDPECYRLAASRLGVPPSDTIVFEDAEAGIRAGLAAGTTVVVVGDWASATTVGLARVRDYTAVVAAASGSGITLTLP